LAEKPLAKSIVMRPESLFADGRRGDDRSIAIALASQIDDGEEVAILAPLVANPGEQITRRRLDSLIGGGKRIAHVGKCDDEGKDGHGCDASQRDSSKG
jgi:hypothetical protein